jgi:hypothetical protein
MAQLFSTLKAAGTIVPASEPRVAIDRVSAEYINNLVDPEIRSAWDPANEVQTILEQTGAGAGDTYTLTFDIPRVAGGQFTTAAIAYNATAATIETAIDVAATASAVAGWTNGDITVAEAGAAGVDDGTVTLTFDGTSVAQNPVVATVLTATGFTKTGVVARTTPGSSTRYNVLAMMAAGVCQVAAYNSLDTPTVTAPVGKRPRIGLVLDLAKAAAADDGSDAIYTALRAIYPSMPPIGI